MSNTNELFPVVREEIDFETLMAQAMQVLNTCSGQYWTDMAEHDPGITLLEAQGYGVADLAYRQTRPLTDLLTPENPAEGEGLFPVEFGPLQSLTCGPISEDDYRRALLDLRSSDAEDGYFLFLNAQLIREPEAERYEYWYDTEHREYSFVQPSSADGAVSMTLLGNYHLYLVPSRDTLLTPQATEAAQAILDAFLLNNRNLGESVSRVIWLVPEDLTLKLVVELEDNIGTNSNIAAILADIYKVAENYVTPAVRHVSTEQLQAEGIRSEEIYQGPWLQYGWIPELPSQIDGTTPATVNLSGLVSVLQDVVGVKGIRELQTIHLGFPVSTRWQWIASRPGVYPRLWGSDPLAVLADGEIVTLLACGDVPLTAPRAEIAAELEIPTLIHNQPPGIPSGRWRNPGRYYPATDRVPPCYNLRVPAKTPPQSQLHQFLLVFEQLLADGCQQLALLPKLLAFQREGDLVWGHQWPFKDGSVSDEVHRTYRQALESYLAKSSNDRKQELSIIDFLLGYFNSQLAQEAFNQRADQFLASQQGFLSHHTELTYHRANIRVDKVSSLHRRIAARLGLGGAKVFDDNTRPDQLPFFLVEHRALMPLPPSSQYDSEQTPVFTNVTTNTGTRYLVLSAGEEWNVADLAVGQLIDLWLGYATSNALQIRGLMVKQVNQQDNSFWLDIDASIQLSRQLYAILTASSDQLAWQNSLVWLKDMTWPLVYDEDSSGLTADQKRLSCSPFPVMVRDEDSVTLSRPVTKGSGARQGTNLEVDIIEIDRIQNTMIVQKKSTDVFPADEELSSWSWYFTNERQATADRFSFINSVVFNQDLLLGLTSDPYATEAWVREMILAEVPSHTGVLIHWKPRWEFNQFATTYQNWLDSGSVLGDMSYDLMNLLALGQLPDGLLGIGTMFIATEAQQEIGLGDSIGGWNETYIENNSLFHVPCIGTVTLSVVTNNSVANGVDANRVTASVHNEDGLPVANAKVLFWADNGAIIESSGSTDDTGSVTMALNSFTPGISKVTAVFNDVSGIAEVTFVAPQALNATLTVNGHTFSANDGFPTTGFTQAAFQVQLTGENNSDYTWSASQPWVSVNDNGHVTFIAEPTGTTKTVRLLLVPKSGSGNNYAWTFTVNSWFLSAGDLAYTWSAAADFCASHSGYSQPTVQQLNGNANYNSGTRGTRGGLWSEWGALNNYSANFPGNSIYWSSDVNSTDSHYLVNLSSGGIEARPDVQAGYAVGRKPL